MCLWSVLDLVGIVAHLRSCASALSRLGRMFPFLFLFKIALVAVITFLSARALIGDRKITR